MLFIAPPLLTWFSKNRRSLPFREDPTPYHIWVSEIMLQQTRMTAVLPYYERFMKEFPTPAALAAANPDRLHKVWEGLGYYSRANNLQRAAIQICEQYGGVLPRSYEQLRALPGIGDYTAGAIASISYQLPCPAVDGNVLRVFSRLFNDRADITSGVTRKRMTERVLEEMPPDAPGDFNQALMELGALICTPGNAACSRCPLQDRCAACAAGTVSVLPVKPEKKPRRREFVSVLLIRADRQWLLQRRPAHGLLAGMWQPLSFMHTESAAASEAETLRLAAEMFPELSLSVAAPLPRARHIFTHIEWELGGWLCNAAFPVPLPDGFAWVADSDMDMYAIPNAFKAYKKYLYETDSTLFFQKGKTP